MISNALRPFHLCFVVRGFETDKNLLSSSLIYFWRQGLREREMVPPCLLGKSLTKPPAVRSRRKRGRLEETLQKGF